MVVKQIIKWVTAFVGLYLSCLSLCWVFSTGWHLSLNLVNNKKCPNITLQFLYGQKMPRHSKSNTYGAFNQKTDQKTPKVSSVYATAAQRNLQISLKGSNIAFIIQTAKAGLKVKHKCRKMSIITLSPHSKCASLIFSPSRESGAFCNCPPAVWEPSSLRRNIIKFEP